MARAKVEELYLTISQLIEELKKIKKERGDLYVYATKTEGGITFYPDGLYQADIVVENNRVYLG